MLRAARTRRRGAGATFVLALAAAAAAMSTPIPTRADPVGPQVIYGKDNRLEIFESSAKVKKAYDASMSVFHDKDVVDQGDGTSRLKTRSYAEYDDLCPGERFFSQRLGPFCSAVLVAPDVVATAGHCVNKQDFTKARFVFGYQMLTATKLQDVRPNSQIYRAVKLLGRQLNDTNEDDYAVLQLDRPVPDHVPAKLRLAGTVADGEQIFVIGYPVGLPAKSASKATVLDNSNPVFFTSNLDTYGGNSGSPVFSAADSAVVGLLVRGETDFVQKGECFVSNMLPNAKGGEDTTRVARWSRFVPQR